MTKYKRVFLILLIVVLIISGILVALYRENNRIIIKMVFDSYITGNLNENPLEPLYIFYDENEIMETSKDDWYRLDPSRYNTKGFINDFYCPVNFGQPRKIYRGREEKICVIVPNKNESYYDAVNRFMEEQLLIEASLGSTEKTENVYRGGDEYCGVQSIRFLRKRYNRHIANTYVDAFRLLILNNFVSDNDQLIYIGEMTSDEVKKNCDLLMNEFRNKGKTAIFRNLIENKDFFQYNFYSFGYTSGDVQIPIIFRDIYIIDKNTGYVDVSKEIWKAGDKGLTFF